MFTSNFDFLLVAQNCPECFPPTKMEMILSTETNYSNSKQYINKNQGGPICGGGPRESKILLIKEAVSSCYYIDVTTAVIITETSREGYKNSPDLCNLQIYIISITTTQTVDINHNY